MDKPIKAKPQFKNFSEFWPYYLSQHAKRETRLFHYFGVFLSLGVTVYAVASHHYWILVFSPFLGYVPAWTSHFMIEKNKPATFDYPFYSFLADFKMTAVMLVSWLKSD